VSVRDKRLLYHLTRVDNLSSILALGLLSRRALRAQQTAFADHGDVEILQGRAEHDLDAYVPFHFMSRTPFDFAVIRRAQDRQFVLIAVSRAHARANGWRIIPQHPLSLVQAPELLDWDSGMDRINWSQMDKSPRDYATDHDCKVACMAEALSPQAVEASMIQSFFVATEGTEQLVRSAIKSAGLSCHINVMATMFPRGAR
jgi:hypothetical protein